MKDLKKLALDLRRDVLEIVMAGKSGHIGGDMSVMDILTVLYHHEMNISPENARDPDRDRFILSKGHAVEALYAVLASKGFFALEDVLDHYGRFASAYIGHPHNHIPGIEMNSGSLGHGLSVCVGMALAGKKDGRGYRVYTVMGDGELAEGSIWEAAMAAAHYRLDNLLAVIDRNGLQISGPTEEVMAQENLAARWAAFGWHVIDGVNGNSADDLIAAFARARNVGRRPTVILAKTVKGYGASIMENQAAWHHKVPTSEEYRRICRELEGRRERIG